MKTYHIPRWLPPLVRRVCLAATRSCGVILTLAAAAGAIAAGTEAGPTKPIEPLTVAVFDFEGREELGKDFGKDIAALVTASLSTNPALITVERTDLDRLLTEQAIGLSGLADPATTARVGHLTGARVLVTGRAFRAGNELVVIAKIIGTETSRVFGEVARAAKDAPLPGPADALAVKIADTIVARSEALVAPRLPRTNRIAALKAVATNTPLPTVSVSIPEVHIGAPAVDPAAQTELSSILKEVGFGLADNQSLKPADIEITGEAFSEAGLRRGGLFSCRARVEIKVRDRATGRILLADRQTTVAVDIAEHIAAKKALQEAGAELAGRVVPRIAK